MRSDRASLWFALALTLLNGLLYLFIVPPWQHYDEPSHFEYAWLIANRPELPQPGDYDQTMRQEVAASMIEHGFYRGIGGSPNLLQSTPIEIGIPQIDRYRVYYWLAALPLRLLSGSDVTLQLYAARTVSLFLFLVSVLGGWGLIRELTHPESTLRWLIPACLALLPAYADLMTSVNNDVAAAAFATLLLWGIVRLVQRGFSWGCMAWCVAWAAICFWTKTTTFPVIGSLALALPLSLLKERGRGMVWTMFGLLTAITLLLALQWDEVSGWFHTGTQQGANRRATSQTYSGQYAFELSPGISSAAYRQIIPVESIQFMRGQAVTVSAWMWSESLDPQPATTPALILENAIPGVLYQAITITHQPVRFTFTSTVPANTGRIWLALQSSIQPISTSIFYDDISVKRTGFDLNLVQNPSAENGTVRLRAVLETKIFPYFGTYPSVLLSTLTSPVSAKDYIVAAVNSLLQTFWARFGWGHVPVLYKAIYPLLNLLFISGTLFGGYIFISRYLRQRHAKVHALAVLGCVVALGWFVAWSRGITSLMENWWLPSARYTYPVVVPTLLFVIGGWVALPNSATGLRLRNWIGGCIAGSFAMLNLLSLISIARFYVGQ